MRLGRIVGAVALVAVLVAGVLVYRKFAMPALPAAEPVSRVVFLDQGWSPEEAARYHYTAQGTLLMPLAWLEVMDAGAFTHRKLTDPDILAGFRYITDGVRPDPAVNRTGLPIGWAVKAWPSPQPARGGPAPPPVQKVGFSCATCHTGQLNYNGVAIRIEGGGSMIDAGAFEDMVGKAVIATDLLPWKRKPFVAEVSRRTGLLAAIISKELTAARRRAVDEAMQSLVTPLYAREGYGRLDALQRIANTLFAVDLHEPDNFQRGDGAVKYPYIWDIGRLDWVQYNGSVRQPMMRNVGEALGVRAETAFISDLTGKPNPDPVRWNSSVQVEALDWMEHSMKQLRAPVWPAEILGRLDAAKAARGGQLFEARCEGCHGIHVARNPAQSEWRVTRIPLAKIGTDPQAAVNFATRTYDGAKLGAGTLSGGEGLRLVTDNIKAYQYDRLKLTPEQRADWDGFGRQGIVEPFLGYKARPLVGIWASPPYLHNGSVPTLHDLLSETRPSGFPVGSREYDPVKVGFATKAVAHGGVLDTSAKGSSNGGHWFASDDRPGRLGPALSPDERAALIEYLKSATYETYPCRVMGGGPPPTADECHRTAPAAPAAPAPG